MWICSLWDYEKYWDTVTENIHYGISGFKLTLSKCCSADHQSGLKEPTLHTHVPGLNI